MKKAYKVTGTYEEFPEHLASLGHKVEEIEQYFERDISTLDGESLELREMSDGELRLTVRDINYADGTTYLNGNAVDALQEALTAFKQHGRED